MLRFPPNEALRRHFAQVERQGASGDGRGRDAARAWGMAEDWSHRQAGRCRGEAGA